MKLRRIISLMLVFATLTLTLVSCDLASLFSQGNESVESTTAGTTTVPEKTTASTTTSTTTSTTPSESTTPSKPEESTTSTTEKGNDPNPPEDTWEDLYDIITIAEAIEIAKAETSINPTTRYYIRGTIVNVSNPAYGEMTITDGTNSIYVYGTYSEDGSIGYAQFAEKPVKGDEVLLHCTLNTYQNEPQVKNARLIDFVKADKEDIDASDYTKMTVLEAREAAIGTKISVTGVVARITYANGMKPSGVYVIDGTNSIYVYDADIAGQVSIGNKITVLGSKAYWVLETEQNNANKHGYNGCCQLEDAILYENDNGTNEIDFSWCEEKTVKEIVNIPVTENVTTTTYKTTALVKKVPGNGFTNYYFYDLDGKTGSYTYTQCNGSDFAWLDEFDGKICTVYLSIINAKSTSSGCQYRFLPVAVIDEGFEFDLSRTPMHLVEYYGVDQFLSTYTGNPVLELVTNVSSELLGFENATLSYTSSNTDVIYFTEEDGKIIFNCGKNGTATITITGNYGDYEYSETVEITVEAPVVESEGLTIEEAINTAVGEIIKVEGIVGPSLVNRDGFYLIDETGVLAIVVNDDTVWEGLTLGQKVVIKGTRDQFNSGSKGYGVTCLTSATVAVNYYGQHEYSTESFITDKTLDDFYALDANEDHSTEVYVAKGTIVIQETAYYSNIKLQTPNGNQITLYSSSANQYNWLKQFAGEEITVEIVPCNWNGKSYWAGCVIAVRTADGKVYNELNFTTGK